MAQFTSSRTIIVGHPGALLWHIFTHSKKEFCMMPFGGMTSVMGHVLGACTGVYCQNMNWNAAFIDVPKFVSGQENGNLGKAKMEV
jgi:hypothetical protein